MNLILFDPVEIREHLLPLTYTKPTAELRVGILTIKEKWEILLQQGGSHYTQEYLSRLYPLVTGHDNLWINGAVCPDEYFLSLIENLQVGQSLTKNGIPIAIRSFESSTPDLTDEVREIEQDVVLIDRLYKIIEHNEEQILIDFRRLTGPNLISHSIDDPHTIIYGNHPVFLEEGAITRAAVLNAEKGPIYLGKNAKIEEGAVLQGPCSIGDYAEIRPNTILYPDTSIGPWCKVGGEVSHSIISGYSNKVHSGFLGHSVIGEWCNLGAGTNTSNLKNNYAFIRLWNQHLQKREETGMRFCGLIMGDHSKCGINSMFNSGTVVGMCSSVYGATFPANFIPSFAWGDVEKLDLHKLENAMITAKRVMERKNVVFSKEHARVFRQVYETAKLQQTN